MGNAILNMKKSLLILVMPFIIVMFTSCKEPKKEPVQEQRIDMSDFYVHTTPKDDKETTKALQNRSLKKTCHTMVVLNRQLRASPQLEKKLYDVEYRTRVFLTSKQQAQDTINTNSVEDIDVAPIEDSLGIINIPVYIHIIYPDSSHISNAQIESQLDVLNADFKNVNTDQLPTGTTFVNDATNAGFKFTLAGTFRHSDPTNSWGTDDYIKEIYPPITPKTHLNVWVCNIGNGILGYAQFPGGNEDTDGIVIAGDFFGVTSGPYGSGRTATHEVGHYLNLRHVWGDGNCNRDDFVADTPLSDRSNGGCPTYPIIHCNTADMTMNYMDYTNDVCMYMFTDGQRNRMRAIFAPDGPRHSMIVN